MKLKTLRNCLLATVVGASTLVKVPSYEIRQAQKAVNESVKI